MKLTEKQENFALEYVLNGGNASEAYRKCYDVGEDTLETSVWDMAHKLLKNPKVSQRVDERREQRFSNKIMSIGERKALLTKWADEGNLKAVEMLNKMEGVYIEKHEHAVKQEVHYYAPEKNKDK